MDAIEVASKEYKQLNWSDRQKFDELNSKEFTDVVKSIEEKGTRTLKVILRLENMQQLRRKISQRNKLKIDDFGDFVIDSSLVVGAKIIQKFLLLKK